MLCSFCYLVLFFLGDGLFCAFLAEENYFLFYFLKEEAVGEARSLRSSITRVEEFWFSLRLLYNCIWSLLSMLELFTPFYFLSFLFFKIDRPDLADFDRSSIEIISLLPTV